MQLCHTHRQLLSRCTLRWYSVGTSSDALAESDVQVPPRLKRPLASNFGGIDIHNVKVRARQVVRHHRNSTTKGPSQSNDSDNQSPDVHHTSQTEHKRVTKSSHSGWGDGLVSFSFARRLRQRQVTQTSDSGTESHPQEARSPNRNSYQAQHSQMRDHPRGQRQQQQQQQQEHDDTSHQRHYRGKTETRKYDTRAAVQQGNRTSAPPTDAKNNKPNASSMTRPSSSPLDRHRESTTAAAAATKSANANTASRPSSSNAPATQHQQPTTSLDRKARLATLSSTNLSALFGATTNTPTAGKTIPSLPASTTTRVRSVLERSAGDYSRFLPRSVGVRKDASRLPALSAARNALATQRDVSLEQRRVALHIIGGLVQPRREVRV